MTAYTYNFDGLQLSTFDGTTISYQIKNAAEARTRGIEGSLDWRATDRLSLRGAFGYNQARYLSFPNASCYTRQVTLGTGCSPIPGSTTLSQNLSGRPLVRAPDWSLNLGGNYDPPLGRMYTLGVSADANYSSSYFTIDTNDPFTKQNGFWRANASLRLQRNDQKFELAVIGRNLFNKLYKTTVLDNPSGTPGEYIAITTQAREVSLQATLRF